MEEAGWDLDGLLGVLSLVHPPTRQKRPAPHTETWAGGLLRECLKEENWMWEPPPSHKYAMSSVSLRAGGADSLRRQREVGVGSLWRRRLSWGPATLWCEVQ